MGDDGVRGGRRSACVLLFMSVAAMWMGLTAGCDKLLGSSPKTTPSTTTASPPQATTGFPQRPTASPGEMLAKINDKVVSKRDVELAVQELRATTEAFGQPWTPLATTEQPDQYDLHDLLNDLVVAELRSQDALARGLERDAEFARLFWYRYRTFLNQEWVRWQMNRITISQTEVDQYYQTYQRGFRDPEQIRVRQLVVASEEQAKSSLVQLLEGVDFATVAQQIALRPEAAAGSLVEQWVMRAEEKAAFAPGDDKVRDLRDPVLEQAAFAIDQVGGVSSYVKGADGHYHIFQLVERKAGRQRPLVEVADDIQNFLRLQRLNKLTEDLKKKVQIERWAERLGTVQQ